MVGEMAWDRKEGALSPHWAQPLGGSPGIKTKVPGPVEPPNGAGPADLRDLSLDLSAWMFYLGERTKTVEEGRRLAETMIATGQALEKFRQGIGLQGGDERVIDEPDPLPIPRLHSPVAISAHPSY